jgi:hypothetical protein
MGAVSDHEKRVTSQERIEQAIQYMTPPYVLSGHEITAYHAMKELMERRAADALPVEARIAAVLESEGLIAPGDDPSVVYDWGRGSYLLALRPKGQFDDAYSGTGPRPNRPSGLPAGGRGRGRGGGAMSKAQEPEPVVIPLGCLGTLTIMARFVLSRRLTCWQLHARATDRQVRYAESWSSDFSAPMPRAQALAEARAALKRIEEKIKGGE